MIEFFIVDILESIVDKRILIVFTFWVNVFTFWVNVFTFSVSKCIV